MDRGLARLYLVTGAFAFAQALGLPLVPEVLALEHGASRATIGVVMGIHGAMQILLRLPMGDMADRRGRRRQMLLAFGLTFAAGLALVLARDVLWIAVGVALFGFAAGVFWVAANSYLFDRVSAARHAPGDTLLGGPEPESRTDIAKASSDYALVTGAAFLVGPFLGHVLAAAFGFAVAFASFLLTSAVGVALLLALEEAPRAPRPPDAASPYRRALRVARHPAIAVAVAGTLVYSVLLATLTSFFQLHVLEVGLGLVAAGSLLAARQAAATGVRVGLPRLLRQAGPRAVLLAALAGGALSLALVPFATTTAALAAVVLLFGAATGLIVPANLMLLHEGAPPHQRGLANGVYGTVLGLGHFLGPVAFGALGEIAGAAWTFWGAGAASLAAVGALAWVGRAAA